MTTYILKRLLLIPLMLFGITVISFCIILLAPGTSTAAGSADRSTKRLSRQQLEIMQETFHVGQPLWKRYFYWLGVMQPEVTAEQMRRYEREGKPPPRRGMLFGDFGRSVNTPTETVAEKMVRALPVTLAMNLIEIFVLYLVSIPLGIYSATHPYSRMDRLTTVGLFILYSLPSFWVAILLMKGMVMLKSAGLPSLPFQGLWPDNAENLPTLQLIWECSKHLFLPILCSCYAGLAGLSRFMRVGMMDIIRSDFIRTARAKGCSEQRVVYKHALRNSLIPIVTIVAGLLPGLIGGSVIIEAIFNINGMGLLAYNAVLTRDYTVTMAVFTLSAVLTLVGLLASDILYTLVDPRISFEKGA